MIDKIKKVFTNIFTVLGIIGVFVMVIVGVVLNSKKTKANSDKLTEKIKDLTKNKNDIDDENDKLKDDLEVMEKQEKAITDALDKLDKENPKKIKKLTPDEMLKEFRDKEKKLFGNN